MGGKHEHEHGGHYHGEPYRALDDRPYPDRIILYPGDTETGFFHGSLAREDLEYWQSQLGSIEGVSQVEAVCPEGGEPSGLDSQDLFTYPEGEPGKCLQKAWLSEPSLLLIPGRLRIDPGAWSDLTRNDVTVNWIAVDPDPGASDRAGAKILSDWIIRVGPDLPPGRTAGSLPGILHLKQGDLENFVIELSRTRSVFASLNGLFKDAAFKLRPGFLRERNWYFREEETE